MWNRLPCWFDEKLGTQLLVHGRALDRILRCERTAPDQESPFALDGVDGDAAPKQMQQIEVAMLGVHTGAAKLDHLAAKRFVLREIKFLLPIGTDICRRELTGLQPIRADDFAGRDVFDD